MERQRVPLPPLKIAPMPTAIALHWNETALHYAVALDGQVKAAASVALESGMSPAAIGQRLAVALAPYSPARAKVIVALGRGDIECQHLSLPPCPADELPDVVQLQADRDLASSENVLGFDFLPLVGDEQTAYQVLTFDLAANKLAKIRQICEAANLTLERIVPLAAGWPALTEQASPSIKLGTHVFAAPLANEATLWATRAGRVVLFRQFQLASGDDATALATAVGSELRRTLLALSQQAENSIPSVTLVGKQQEQLAALAKTLDQRLDVSVQSLAIAPPHTNLPPKNSSALPLVGFAVDESLGKSPLVDLLHPRQRPKKQVNVRTYALAATAGALLLALLGWTSYSKLQAPLYQADQDQAELTLLEESLENLKVHEQRALAIQNWHAEAPNLLHHLQQLSQSIRPKSLEEESFSDKHDVVLEKFHLDKRQLTLEAMARNSRAIQPLESRLRKSDYRSERVNSNSSKTLKEYPWYLKSEIEITTASDTVDTSASQSPAEEPQS